MENKMELVLRDVFLIRTQEYKNIYYKQGKNREAIFFYYKDQSKQEIHKIRMIYYLSNISVADWDFFQFIIEMRKQKMEFSNFDGLVPPEVQRTKKTKLYSFLDGNFKLTHKGVDILSFMRENQHLKCEEHMNKMDTYELIQYHVLCFKFWLTSQNG